MSRIPPWTWRDAIRQADVPPLTKLVCYSIGNYLSDVGAGCFPGIEQLMADSGLSNRSMATHLQNAVDAGLIAIEKRRSLDGRHLRNHYLPKFPDAAELPRHPATNASAETGAAIAPETASETSDMQDAHSAENQASGHVNLLHTDATPREPPSHGPCEPDDISHVKEVHANSPRDNTPRKERFPLTPASGGTGPSAGFVQDDTTLTAAARSKQAGWLATLRAEGRHGPVVEGLIAPLLERFRFSSSTALADLRAAAASSRNLPGPHLAKVLQLLADDGVDTVKPPRLAKAIDAVKAGGLMVAINRQRSPQQWRAWVDHFATTSPKTAQLMDRFDSWTVPASWPPSAKPLTAKPPTAVSAAPAEAVP